MQQSFVAPNLICHLYNINMADLTAHLLMAVKCMMSRDQISELFSCQRAENSGLKRNASLSHIAITFSNLLCIIIFSRAFLQVVTHLVSEWQRCRRWQSPLSLPHQGTGYHWSSWTDTCKANQTLSFATFSADTQLLLLHLFAIITSSSYSLPLHNS